MSRISVPKPPAFRPRSAQTRRKLRFGTLERWNAKNTAHPYTHTHMHGDMHMGVPCVPYVPSIYIYNYKLLNNNNNKRVCAGTKRGTLPERNDYSRSRHIRDTSPLVHRARDVQEGGAQK